MSVETALRSLRLEPRFARNIVHWEHVPARPARYAPFPKVLDHALVTALHSLGIEALYTHQAAALSAALARENMTVVTPAASGKTLCYNLPVLQKLLADPCARALYLYPTKALAQDQLAQLHGLIGLLNEKPETKRQVRTTQSAVRTVPPLLCATYDGDTPSAQRARIRENARIILSNPDMLHAGILPQHPRWAGFLANLAVVVVDEMHVYRGVFGSHVANVLRRLQRICRFYGSNPQFLLASATIANPAHLSEHLIEMPVTVIGPDQDGSPQGERHILFYNPPMLDPELGIRRSSIAEAVELAAHFLAHEVQTIVFAQTRLSAELILSDLRAQLSPPSSISTNPQSPIRNPQSIRGYRSGYLPEERRNIERGLREGSVRAVVATNALELGIDIGQLDATVLAGYPGTIASARQQMGRAGRRTGPSVSVLIAGPDALDQYIITHPDWLFGRSPEHARINPDNEVILAGHLACAAAELPIRRGEPFNRQAPSEALLNDLIEAQLLHQAGDRYFWAGEGSPTSRLSLRSTGPDRVIIQATDEAGRPRVIGEMDRPGVLLLLYKGAIYLHEGQTYLVERLEWEAGVAHVREIAADYYTRPVINEKVEMVRLRGSYGQPTGIEPPLRISGIQATWGDVRVTREATGYKILRRGTNEVLGFGTIDLPAQILETQACQLLFTEELIAQLRAEGRWFSDPNDYGPNWPAQRDAARARDNYRCQSCGQGEQNGRQHDVHHKIPFRAFVADPTLRQGLTADQAWCAANRLENLVTLCPACHRRVEAAVRIRTGLGGVAALLAGVAPLFLMCDSRDLGVVADPQDPATGAPAITVYEKVPGGVGYAEQLALSLPQLVQAAQETVDSCPCTTGCPGCVGPILEHEYALNAKDLAKALLEKAITAIG